MKKLIAVCAALLVCAGIAEAQLSCTNASYRTLTSYTNGMTNDSLFFICGGSSTATLLATPPSGVPGWTFTWQKFNAPGNNWNPLAIVTDAPLSQQSNLQPGGYRVIITDGTNAEVGSYIVWICKMNINPFVNVNPIPAGCGNVQLTGQINAGTITPYYNPPVLNTDPESALLLNSSSTISVCFTGLHSWISDLGFYLIGPASCGSPVITLSPNPGSNGQGNICNSADNFTNLCFSSSSTAIFNPCAPGTYSGTYGGYGVGAGTMINWNALNGCDASQSGWSVQVYDCVGGDTGSLTGASISFSGTSVGGEPITYTYSSPSGFSSPIGDNSCSPTTASIFTVPASPAVSVTFPTQYQWVANPPFPIPNNTSSLNILLSPGPTVDTQFTLSLVGTHPGAICGGSASDTESFHYIPPSTAVITAPSTSFCTIESPITLTASVSGGTWSGTGITNASTGVFNPAVAGVGAHTITYSVPGGCVQPGTITLNVTDGAVADIVSVVPMCDNAEPLVLIASPAGGVWSGAGITNTVNGTFDPSVAGVGEHVIYYTIGGACPAMDSISIQVTSFVQPSITVPSTVCINDGVMTFTAVPANGVWSGNGISSSGTFDPQLAGNGVHTITYTLGGNCEQIALASVEVFSSSEVTIQPVNAMCSNGSVVQLTASIAGGTWNGIGIVDGVAGTFDPASAGAGIHTIEYEVSGGCPATGSVMVEVLPFTQPSLAVPSSVCVNDLPMSLNSFPSGGNWSGNGVDNNGVFNPSNAGVGNASITYSIGGQCPGNTTATIVVNDVPAIAVNNNLAICAGEQVVITASGAQSYVWTPSAGLSANNVSNPTASPTTTTTYTVTGTTNGCSTSEQVTVMVYPVPQVNVNGPFTICPGDSVQLSAAGLINFTWNPTGSLSNAQSAQPWAYPTSTTTYQVQGTDANGCVGTGSVLVEVVDVAFVYTPEQGLAPLEVTFTNMSDGDLFLWDFGNSDNAVTTHPSEQVTTTYYSEGVYTIVLTVDIGNTECSVSHTVVVIENSGIQLIPNIVTADGSGKNDHFSVVTTGMKTLQVTIFDRWGKEVGSIGTPQDSWNPREYPDGTYFFVLSAEGWDGKTYTNSGNFTVVH